MKTSIVFARKWRPGEIADDSGKVCLLKMDAVGYDASGRQTHQSDIAEAIHTLEQFLKTHGW